MLGTPSEAGPLRRYGIAVLAAVVAFAASYVTWPFLKTMPWVFFFAAIMVSAWFGGQGPSMLATAILVLIGRYFFIRPLRHIHATIETPCCRSLIFIGVSLFIGFLASAVRRAEGHERSRTQAVSGDRDEDRRRRHRDRRRGQDRVHERRRRGTDWLEHGRGRGKTARRGIRRCQRRQQRAGPDPRRQGPGDGLVRQVLGDDMILIARDGRERPIDDSAAPIKDDRGETTGVVLVFHDVTRTQRRPRRNGAT